jgi:sarcosine oxidase
VSSHLTADVAVAGAGIFGVSTALTLVQRGVSRVLLLDAWGVGNSRATSGDHTRVWRTAYGKKCLYSRWAWESLPLWKHWEAESGQRLFTPTGVLWIGGDDPEFPSATRPCLTELGIPLESWTAGEASARFPQFAGIEDRTALWEPLAGVLHARRACLALAEMFKRDGGMIETAAVLPPEGQPGRLSSIALEDGRTVCAGAFVFACGPWLLQMFPSLLGQRMRVTRQELFYFAPPLGSTEFDPGRFPTWIEEGTHAGQEFSFYGMPALDGAVKVASDNRGPEFDPTHGDRNVSRAGLDQARQYLAQRFPALADAPLVESRVCQYEQTPDSHLIVDRHPAWDNVWIAGGGSGHGFKMAPAMAQCLVAAMASTDSIPSEVRLKSATDEHR